MDADIPFPIRRDSVDGIPVFWAEAPAGPPFVGAAVFRVGRVDETVPTSGITHLVEHLAMPVRVPGAVQFNASVDLTTTTFWASGARDGVLAFFGEIFASLRSLPVGRLERERSILQTEASGREHSSVDFALMLRYGARGPGMTFVDEFGLAWLAAKDVSAWSRERFTAGNCALYFTGPPPESLPELPPGERRLPPEPEAIDYVRYPSVFQVGLPGGVAVSLAPRRSPAFLVASAALYDRVVERIRLRLGLSYSSDWWWEPVTDDSAESILSVDCLPENVDAARSALLTELDELARRGLTDDELARDREQIAQSFHDPSELPADLFRACRDELFGGDFMGSADVLAARSAVTAADGAEAIARAADEMLLLIPEDGTRPGGRFVPYPVTAPFRVDGRRFRRRGLPFRRAGDERELAVGEEGVTLIGAEFVNTVRFSDVEGLLRWEDGSRLLVGADATFITVDPAIWRGGAEAVAAIDAAVPESRVVPMETGAMDRELQEASEALDRGDPEAAVALLRDVVARRPDEALVHAQLAASYHALERWPETLAAANRTRELDPNLEWGPRFRAYALWNTGRHELALEAGREALALEPSDLQTLADFSWFEAEAGDPAEARRIADRALELYPDEAAAWFARSWAAMSVGDWDDSEEACRKAIELQPRESMWHNNLGWILLQRGRDREAMKAFDRALKLDRHNGRAKFNRAYGLREQGREAEATKELGRLLAEEIRRADASGNGGPHADDLAHQARMLGQLGRMPESREKLEAAVRAEPDRADLLGDLVAARVDLEEYEAAHEALARAREIAPESIDTLYAQGYLAAATGDVSLARPAAEAMERVHPTHRLTPDVAGYAAVCEEDWPRAADLFRRTLDRLPLRSCSQAWLAVALHRGGAADEAAGHAAQARQRCSVQCRCASIRALDGTTG